MNLKIKQMCIVLALVSTSLPMFATHYINNTGKVITVTNVSAKKRTKKSYFSTLFTSKKRTQRDEQSNQVMFIDLEDDAEGDLDNKQDDEIAITSQGISDKRKLFPTNNSFNYVITMNKYSKVYEKFDINHAGEEDKVKKIKHKKNKVKHKKNKNDNQ